MREQRQANVLLNTLLDQDTNGLAILSGPDLVYRFANAAYCLFIPNFQQNIIGRPYSEGWPAAPGLPDKSQIEQVMARGQPVDFEHVVCRLPDGSQRMALLRVCPMDWGETPAVLLILCAGEEKANPHSDLAWQQAQQLHTNHTEIADLVMIFDAEEQIIHANQAALDLCGNGLVGMNRQNLIAYLNLHQPDGQALLFHQLPSEAAHGG